MKIGVVGSRSFNDYQRLEKALDEMDLSLTDLIVSGGCPKGADALAEMYAKNRRMELKVFPADWERFGKGAGIRRNWYIVRYCDFVVIFWDGVSKGSESVIRFCCEQKKPFKVIFCS